MKITDIILSPEKIIATPKGDILHALKNNSNGYVAFGEAYFSFAKQGEVKAWKKHNKMTLNLLVPVGRIKFVIYDPREDSVSRAVTDEIILGRENYQRLTIPPGLWCGFQGLDEYNMLLNIADILHDPNESERMDSENNLFKYQW